MPWNDDAASRKHHKDATGAHGKMWRSIANSTLDRTGDEGRAIRTANAALNNRMGKSKRFGKKS